MSITSAECNYTDVYVILFYSCNTQMTAYRKTTFCIIKAMPKLKVSFCLLT